MMAEKYFVYIPKTLELSLVLLIAWSLASYLVPTHETSPHQTVSSKPNSTKPQPVSINHTPIFGHISSKPKPQATTIQKPKPVHISPLTMQLLGTIVAGKHSAAIIRINTGAKQRMFALHDTLQPHVTLEQVEAQSITVNHNGTLETIYLKKDAAAHHAMPTHTPTPSTATPPSYQARQTIHRSYLNRNLHNFPKLLSQARVVPHFNQGKPDGFVINNIAPNSLYQHIGLRDGDIILKVNGQAITSAQQGMQMYQALQNASSIDLELRRNGATLPIHYQIQ